MATCNECGKKIGILEPEYDGKCGSCYEEIRETGKARTLNERETLEQQKKKLEEIKAAGSWSDRIAIARQEKDFSHFTPQERQTIIGQIRQTTGFQFTDIEIVRELKVISAEVVYGLHFGKELLAGIRDIVGGRTKSMQGVLREARENALDELCLEAVLVGGNGIIGIDLDYQQLDVKAAGGPIMLVASGTAVVTKKHNDV